jgi:hypothetical protein
VVGAPPLGELVRGALRDQGRSLDDLADAAQVTRAYMQELVGGRRRPPLPGRGDVYDKMAAFLRISRPLLEASALAGRQARAADPAAGPAPEVAEALLALCEPETARVLKRRRARDGGAELAQVTRRVLDVVHGLVRRMMDDELGVRVAAMSSGSTYVAVRVALLEFLDTTPETLTLADLTQHVVPRVARWDVELEGNIVRVVLRPSEPRESGRRRPQARRAVRPRD